jgi:hypothetical protein
MKGELLKGKLRINEEYHQGIVILWLDGKMIQVKIEGIKDINRSINGDEVII